MAPPQLQTVLLSQSGEIKSIKIPQKLTLAAIKKALKVKEDVELLGTYEYQTYYLYLFGAIDGKEGTENEHELPPPHDNILVFGDILVIASQTKEYTAPVVFTVANYEKFYQFILEGLDEEEEEEEIIEEEEEEILDEEEEELPELEEEPEDEHIKPNTTVAAIIKKKAPIKSKQHSLLISPDFKELNEDSSLPACRISIRNLIETLIPEAKSTELEFSIYKASLKEANENHIIAHWKNVLFETHYISVARRIIGNLSNSYVKNTRLIQRLKEQEFTYDELASKNYYELFPETWKELSDRQIVREQKLLEGNKGMATDQFKCHGCGKRESTYYEMQTRSADEPMTIFITCLNCGKRWRQ